MRSEESDGEELWFGLFCFELFDGPIDHEMIAVGVFSLRKRSSSEEMIAERAFPFESVVLSVRKFGTWPVGGDGIERVAAVFVPCLGVILRVTGSPLQGVKNLACPGAVVAVITEVFGEDDGVGEDG